MSGTAGHYDDQDEGGTSPVTDVSTIVSSPEISQMVTTARAYPRSLTEFRRESWEAVGLTPEIATQCTYVLPKKGKDGKFISGASARFAEIITSAWGNMRVMSRIVSTEGDYVVAEGVAWDVQKNSAQSATIMRRIVDKDGNRYSVDMIGITGNAAASIARRNAILAVIPKPFWNDIHEHARTVARGDEASLADRRIKMLRVFKEMSPSVLPHQLFNYCGRAGVEDLTLDDIFILGGIANAIKEGDASSDSYFGNAEHVTPPKQTKANEFTRAAPAAQAKAEPAPAVKQEPAKVAESMPKEAPAKAVAAPAKEPEPQPEPEPAQEPATEPLPQQPEADPMAEFIDDLVQELKTCTMVRQASALKAKASEVLPAPLLKQFSDLADVKIRDILNTTKPAPAKKK